MTLVQTNLVKRVILKRMKSLIFYSMVFFEVDDIIDRRINSKTHEYEYRVRFRGYAESDDAWRPASSFNRPVDFSSSSRYDFNGGC